MYLFFDTETTGLPQRWNAPLDDLENWPRLVQLAWILYDYKGEEIKRANHIIYPEGFTIPLQAQRVHGISTAQAIANGRDLSNSLHEFASAIGEAGFLIAHNISFDKMIMGAEFLRKQMHNPLGEIAHICTMKTTSSVCQIPGRNGFKWPNLGELHSFLFNKGFDNAHDAMADVQACADCFFELQKRGMYQQQAKLF